MEVEKDLEPLIQRLRSLTPPEQAVALRTVAADADTDADIEAITNAFLVAIAAGSLPAPAIQTWLGVTRTPLTSVPAFRQRHSVVARRIAGDYLSKQLRAGPGFRGTWDALGEAEGIAHTMTAMSTDELRRWCSALGRPSTRTRQDGMDVRFFAQRQQCVTELFDLLTDKRQNEQEKRQVLNIYTRLLPACTSERAIEWADKLDQEQQQIRPETAGSKITNTNTTKLQRKMRENYWDAFQRRAFEQVFSSQDTNPPKGVLDKLQPFTDRSADSRLKALEAFVDSPDLLGETPGRVLSKLIVPLVRGYVRSWRRDNLRRDRLWRLINAWLEKHYRVVQGQPHPDGDETSEKELVSWADRYWDPSAEDDSINFRILFSVLPKLRAPDIEKRVTRRGPGVRYRFLRLLLLNSPGYGFDIGDATEASSAGLKGIKLSVNIFPCLPGTEGLVLFERCLEANPNLSFLDWGTGVQDRGIFDQKLDMHDDRADAHILRAALLQRLRDQRPVLPPDPGAVVNELRTAELTRRKTTSAEGGEPEIRAFWALSALRLCIALDDVDLLRETFLWARRYNRDPFVVPQLYGAPAVFRDLEDMLSCIDARYQRQDGGLQARIQKANAVVMVILETACMVTREPSFRWVVWRPALNMVSNVAVGRLSRLDQLQEHLCMSDDEAFTTVLLPTLDLLIAAEALLLRPENERLERTGPRGLLEYHRHVLDYETAEEPKYTEFILADELKLAPRRQGQHSCKGKSRGPREYRRRCNRDYDRKAPRAPVFEFLDQLAIRRDKLWEEHRPRSHPAVTTLPAPWPRGLAVQHLVSGPLEVIQVIPPYVRSRIEAVIFCDAEIASQPVPMDDEVSAAVGRFVDSWPQALRLWLSEVDGEENRDKRESRILRAWNHALHCTLRTGYMSTQEAQRFCLEHCFRPVGLGNFVESMIETGATRHVADMPPPSENGQYPTEWDPDPDYGSVIAGATPNNDIQNRPGALTCFDCMLLASHNLCAVLKSDRPRIPAGPDPINFWDLAFEGWGSRRGPWGKEESTIDALIAAAVLRVNSAYGADASLLMKPFPDTGEPRFPGLYLDQGFLERTQDIELALAALERLLPFIPPQLLANLVVSMMKRMETMAPGRRNYVVFARVVTMLARSDNPALAAPLIQRFILADSKASSWYRMILNHGIFKRLAAETAEGFFTTLSSVIIETLREQESRAADTPERASPPLVKVTTVKMIAQLVGEQASFIDPKVSLHTLMEIARVASHVDIRLEAVRNLQLFARDDNDDREQRILATNFLREWAPSIAGAMNERHPETEADWAAENGTGGLPGVSPLGSSARRIMRSFINEWARNDEGMLELCLRILAVSAENNTRWTKLFLRRCGFTLRDVDDLPRIPTCHDILPCLAKMLLRRHRKLSALPIQQFESMRRYVLMLLDPPESLLAITKSVEESAELSRSSAGKHFLMLWKPGRVKSDMVGGEWMCETLHEFTPHEESPSPGSVTLQMLEDAVMAMAEVHISKGDIRGFVELSRDLVPAFDSEQGIVIESRGTGKVIRQLISRIESLRTAEWQADRNRQPPRLPDTFSLRLKLLSLRTPPQPNPPTSGQITTMRAHLPALVDGFAELIQRVIDSGIPYTARHSELETHLRRHVEVRFYMASLLGRTDRFHDADNPTPAELLRVHLAVSLLKDQRTAPYGQEHDVPAVREMVRQWELSIVEELREQASRLTELLRGGGRAGFSPLENWLDGEKGVSVPGARTTSY
jgi:hypothetical protein